MRKLFIIFAICILPLAACQKEKEQPLEGKTVTIRASVPQESTKVSLTPSGDGLHLAWEEGDCLRVISGSQSSRFDIQDVFTDHDASFKGTAVGGSSFDILYPGTFASVSEAESSDFGYQTQTGNGSTAHLKYAALLSGVDNYTDIAFTSSWAAAHGGTLKKAGAIKLAVTLPDGVGAVSGISLDLAGKTLNLSLEGVDVSRSEQVLTAYLMTPWNDIVLPKEAPVEVKVTGADQSVYGASFKLDAGATLPAGSVSIFNVTKDVVEYPFAGGDGTADSPYLVANAKHFENLMNLYKDTYQDGGATDFMWYFRLTEDIDASTIAWVSLNHKSPYKRGVNFDGDGHTITGLTAGPEEGYPSFAGVLHGSIKNVTFTGADIDAGNNKAGVVAGFIGTSGGVSGSCSGVTVKNSTVKGTNFIGGFAAQVGSPASFTDCHAIGVMVTQQYATSGDRPTGGFIAHVGADASFTGCSVKASVSSPNADINYVGGFVGRVSGVTGVFDDCHVLAGTSVKGSGLSYGGFAGFAEKSKFTDCSVQSTTLTNTSSGKTVRSGGFIGNVASGVSVTRCSVKNSSINISKSHRVGGFFGQLGDQSTGKNADLVLFCSVQNCTVNGCNYTGGFVGVQYNDIDKSCVSGGSVSVGGSYGGGFTAFVQNGNFFNCYTSASVDSGSNTPVGGFVGMAYTSTAYSCYTSGALSGSGTNVGAFVGECAVQGESYPAHFEKCIAWNSSLPFWASNTVSATSSDCYTGTSGSVSSQATTQAWDTNVWNLSSSEPTLKPSSSSTRVNVAFMGDSITWQWTRSGFHPEYFASHGYVNKGISGENTTQMLTRFPYDVVALHPQVVVIMGGTNDIAQGVVQDDIMANLKAMAELAEADGSAVVLCSVTPCNRTYSAVGGPKTLAILPLNEAIKTYAQSKGFPYCDYYPVLVDSEGGLKAEYMKNGTDDLHPNRAGYLVMEEVIQPILENLLNN